MEIDELKKGIEKMGNSRFYRFSIKGFLAWIENPSQEFICFPTFQTVCSRKQMESKSRFFEILKGNRVDGIYIDSASLSNSKEAYLDFPQEMALIEKFINEANLTFR